jgi:arginine decarboxylase
MNTSYSNLIHQTFNFPQENFEVKEDGLYFNDICLMDVIKQYGTPLATYPK